MNELARYNAMCRAIAEAYAVDEVKDIRDKAAALEHYARQSQNVEAERDCCEIRLRAERRAGELLREMAGRGERAGQGGDRKSKSPDATLKLADLGISKQQSSDWQKLAKLPEGDFEARLKGPEKPTTAGLIATVETKAKEVTPVSSAALWLWGRLQDFERDRLLETDPDQLIATMLDHMKTTTRRLAPLVAAWLSGVKHE